MTEKNSGSPRKRSQRLEQLYTAREMEPQTFQPVQSKPSFAYEGYEPNGEAPVDIHTIDESMYTPNEADPAPMTEAYAPPQTHAIETPEADYSAYYRRDSSETVDDEEPAFVPPPKLDFHSLYADPLPEKTVDVPAAQSNVYRPREVTWAETERRAVLSADGALGYQVENEHEEPRKRRERKHALRRMLAVVLVLCALGCGVYVFREQLTRWLGQLTGRPIQSEAPFEALTTPVPVRGYDAAAPIEISTPARTAIAQLSGTVEMETHAVTDSNVIVRSARADGKYDYYLFTADDGRLLCYFEGLGSRDMFPQSDGGYYVKQSPYLVNANGSAMIRTDDIAATIQSEVVLHPLYNGWAIIASSDGSSANYVNTSGQLLSTLWFARTFPFTGELTTAYVDTGNAVDEDGRFLLYVLSKDGVMTKWRNASNMTEVVVSACAMAYMDSGELYNLSNIDTPLLTADQVDMYLDCDAVVTRDAESGKYGLFVHGEQHYDAVYDSIRPVECDIQWAEKTFTGAGGSITLHAVTDASYPQPLSHYFVLSRDGQEEYVALSTLSAYPILLDGEF